MNSIKEEVTLRECPFCGPSGRLEIYWEDEPHFHLVGCKTCCTQGPSKVHKDEAIAAWNTRSTSDLRAKAEALREANERLKKKVDFHDESARKLGFILGNVVWIVQDERRKAADTALEGGDRARANDAMEAALSRALNRIEAQLVGSADAK